MQFSPAEFRTNVRSNLAAILGGAADKLAANIEIGIYNYAVKEATSRKVVRKWSDPTFFLIYKDRLRTLYTNLQGRPAFVEQVVRGEITPAALSTMTHLEMAPEKWSSLLEKKMKIDESKYLDNQQASTDMFQCRKCKSRRCQYYEMQVRSADESSSVYVNCLDCGKRWRVN